MFWQAFLTLASCVLVSTLDIHPYCSSTTMRISMKSSRNQTGHWISTVGFKEEVGKTLDSKKTGVWLVDVEQTSSTCKSGNSSLETAIFLTAPPPTEENKSVPKDYEYFPGVGYYKYHPEVLIWPQGRKACSAEGGHLIILNSEEESKVAQEILARYPNAGTWFLTGILEQGVHKEYFTIFGEPLETTGFTRFQPGQDDARGPSDYGGMHRNGNYSDLTIAEKYPFICEYDL